MVNSLLEEIIKDFSSCFGLKVCKFNFEYDKVPVAQVSGRNELQGLRNIISEVSSPVSPEFDAIQDQWVEYALIHFGKLESAAISQVLKDLNYYIMDRTYFVGNQFGPADVLLYYLFYNVVSNLTFQEKEKYLHFSRWFSNIQQNEKTRMWRSIVPFSKTLLYT